jgi:signal transduction histidine kinase
VYGSAKPRDVINNYAKEATVELDIVKLSQKTISLITEIFSIHRVGIFIFRGSSELPAYQNVLGFERNQIDVKELQEIMSYWKTLGEDKVLIKGEIRKEAEENNDLGAKRILVLMEENKTNIIIPLNTKFRLNGLLILGAREDRRDLKAEELSLLDELIINASVAISRAVLYQEVQSFNQTLQQKVDLQTKELQVKILELQEARQKETDMIDIMGHELRTPATIVKLNAQLLDKFDKEIESDPQAYKRYVDRIKIAVENEIKLINTLLSSAKLEGDKIVIEPEEINIREEIEMAIHGNEREAKDKNLPIINNVDQNTPNVFADKARVVEVLNNLISNAVKYTDMGSVTVSSTYNEAEVEITVADTGKGISKEDLPKLGQKFYRVSNYTESSDGGRIDIVRPGGTGLGLFVTFNLIRKMGGDIRVESELGKGSKFIFTLPRYNGQKDGFHKAQSNDMFEKLGLKK